MTSHSHISGFQPLLKHLLTPPNDVSDDDAFILLFHTYTLFRTIFKPLCLSSGHTTPLHLTMTQLADSWSRSLDRKVIAAYGDAAGTVNPRKVCGPMWDALELELNASLKRKKQSEIQSIVEIMDAMASTKMVEWHCNYLTVLTVLDRRQVNARISALSDAIRLFFVEWSTLYRTSPDRKFTADLTDFRDILSSNSFFTTLCISMMPKYKASNSAVFLAEQTVRHRNAIQKMETFMASHPATNGEHNGKSGKKNYKSDESSSAPATGRQCKAGDSCLEAHREIDPASKYVLCRCTAGCVLSFHPACYRSNNPNLDEDDVPCINLEGCPESGSLFRIVLKQGKTIIAELLGEKLAGEADLPEDDTGEDDGDDDPTSSTSIRRLAGKTAYLGVAKSTLHRTDRYELGPDGLLIFKDQQKRLEQKQTREAKRMREEEKAAERKKREEEMEKKKEENGGNTAAPAASSTPSKGAASATTKKAPFTFEVVVPLVPQPGESSSSSMPPTKSNLVNRTNVFSRLNLDDDGPGAPTTKATNSYTRNYWQDGPESDSDAAASGPVSLFPITVKKVKKGKGTGRNMHDDEDAQLRAAMAASLADSSSKSTHPTAASALFPPKSVPKKEEFPGLPSAPVKAMRIPASSSPPMKATPVKAPAAVGPPGGLPETLTLAATNSPPAAIQPTARSASIATREGEVHAEETNSSRAIVRSDSSSSSGSSTLPDTNGSTNKSISPAIPNFAMPNFHVRQTAIAIGGVTAQINPTVTSTAAPIADRPYYPNTTNATAAAPIAPPPPMAMPIPMSMPMPPSPALPSPTAAVASMSAPFAKLDVVDSVEESAIPTPVLMLRHLPSCLTIQHIGSQFCVFGKVQVRLVWSISHGLTAIITFANFDAARTALTSMNGRQYELETQRESGSEMERWLVEPIFARYPLTIQKPPITTIKLV